MLLLKMKTLLWSPTQAIKHNVNFVKKLYGLLRNEYKDAILEHNFCKCRWNLNIDGIIIDDITKFN